MSLYLRMSHDPNPNYELYEKAATLAKTLNWAFDTCVRVYPPDKSNPEMYTIHLSNSNIEAWDVLTLLEDAGVPLEGHYATVKMFHKNYLDLLLVYLKMRGYNIQYVKFNKGGQYE